MSQYFPIDAARDQILISCQPMLKQQIMASMNYFLTSYWRKRYIQTTIFCKREKSGLSFRNNLW